MSYSSNETSVDSGSPVEVFEITAGSTTYYLTSAEDAQSIGAQVYTPVDGLERSSTEDGPDRREFDLSIELPTEHAVAQLFLGNLPGYRVRLKIKRFHPDDLPTPEVVQVFDGYVQGVGFGKGEGLVCKITARTTLAAVGRQVPRRTFQSACNHVLYDGSTCRVDDTSPTFRASAIDVASLSGNVLTVTSGLSGTYADGWFEGGYVEVVGAADYRLVLTHVGNVLTLLSPFASTPSTVNVFAGCDHSVSVCKSKFDNVLNFGGFPYVPTRNPFQVGL